MPKTKRATEDQAARLQRLEGVLLNEYPPGYDAHRDVLMDDHEARASVNRLGAALREALELLRRAPRA